MTLSFCLGIRYRLFFAFLVTACCVIISMFVVTRISFERGAFRYVHGVEKERLEQLAQILTQLYTENSGWSFLERSPTSWKELVADIREAIPFTPRSHHGDGPPDDDPPDHGPQTLGELPPPPKNGRDFEKRVLLFDADNRQLRGLPGPWKPEPMLVPINVAGQRVGVLGLVSPKMLNDLRIRHFVREQHHILIVTALCIAAGAALLSLPLSARMVRRITSLARATNRLASGKYDIRVKADSGDEMGQLARDFNRLAQTLESNEQLRRRWVADISHELRTPLAVLRGEIEAVQDGVRPLGPQTLEVLHSEILHLSRLVSDLYELSLADIGALTYRKQQLDWAQLVAQVVDSYREQFADQGLRLLLRCGDQPMPLFGDQERLRQLLVNLLQNTLRYTDPGGQLDVCLQEHATGYRLQLADSAPGVPEEALPRLFDRLFRVESSRNRAHGGAGLGLALCKSIVEAHGGTIQAASSSLGGLEIIIDLPVNG